MSWLDSLVRRPRRHVYGWWTFDEVESSLVRGDGALVRFIGPALDDDALDIRNTGNRQWMRFDLRCEPYTGRSAYPLLVERRDVLDPLAPRPRRLVWRLDHIRSAKLSGAEPPGQVVWQAMDRLAIDALYCWPRGTRAGLRPADVAVSGGWRGGEWTPDLYRAFSGSGIEAYAGDGPFADAPPDPPQRWEMIETAPATAEETHAQFQWLRSAPPPAVAALLPALTQSRPHLRSTRGSLMIPLFINSIQPLWLRWLYVDEDIISDRLRTAAGSLSPAFALEWWFSIESRNCLVGTIDRHSGAYLDFARDVPGYAERTPREGALLFEAGNFPSSTLARFREVVSEAIWSWRDTTLLLPGEDGKAVEVRVRTPAESVLWPAIRYGGMERATTMRAAPRLQHEGGGIRLAWMFAADDGYAPPVRENRVARLDFDGAELVMIDRETNQTLTFERTLQGSADASREQLGLFRYRDDQTDYPIVVRRGARVDQDDGADWVIDHEASAERWRSASGLQSDRRSYPPQDVWRGVASFASDALLAWPDTAAFGPAPRALVAAGGWWAGRWESDIRRHSSTRLLTDMTWRRIREQRLHEQFPLLMSAEDPRVPVSSHADPEPTLAWKTHAFTPVGLHSRDTRDAFGPTTPEITLDPPGAMSVEPVDLSAFAAQRLVDRHHWLRSDGEALLYVCGEHTVMRGGPEPTEVIEPLFEYCDADVRLRLQLSYAGIFDHPMSLTYLLWPRIVRGSRFEEREGVLPASLFLPISGSRGAWRPHARLWHRLVDALEAWVDPARGGERTAVVVRGLYVAGAFDPMGERHTWFDERVSSTPETN